jgi:eukaryotic-like serine/threonine-protein kinase
MSFLPDETLNHLRHLHAADGAPEPRYELGPELGRGGMGVVYDAWDSCLERHVALKVVDALPEPADEARILARLEHPGLVPVYDAGTLPDGRSFYAMRLVTGRRLDEFLGGEPRLAPRLRLFEKICEAVAFAHGRGVIHCDLKPQNIMAGAYGEVFVLDWGIARRTGHPSQGFGTPPYMAPERESLDARSDVYSLGRILEGLAAPAPPAPLASIIGKAAAPAPEDRYPSVQALAEDVARFLDNLPVGAHRDTPGERAARFIRRNQVLLLLLGSYLVVKLAIFSWPRP